MDARQMTNWLIERQANMLDSLQRLVEVETPSRDKDRLDGFATQLEADLRIDKIGDVQRLDGGGQGDHLLLKVGEAAFNGQRPALVLAHYDTVWHAGTLKRMPFWVRDGKAYGPGVYDMKASIVEALYALKALCALKISLLRPIWVMFTSDEEIGSPSSRKYLEGIAPQCEYALVLEPPGEGGELKTSRKGVGKFTVEVFGKASHAGTHPEQGVSAIVELGHQILRLQRMNNPERGTTINIGLVRGGTQRNVIPAKAEAELDVRAWTAEEAARVADELRILQPVTAGTRIHVHGGFGRPPMPRDAGIAALFGRASQAARPLGLALREGASGGGSDANLTAALGVPTLDGLGITGDGAHADHEHIVLASLPGHTALLAVLLASL